MFENYPKVRTELPPGFQKIYAEHYKKNREGETSASSVAQKMEGWMHRKIAEDVKGISDKVTLEIGAGTLNQLNYEETSPMTSSSHLQNFTSIRNSGTGLIGCIRILMK